ncbi:hypothetical protein KY362_08080 [Candidatus Woesearchaeota archaeon]|nr:hypothetical protein [Candidatus Woesearchaeota archaeon]
MPRQNFDFRLVLFFLVFALLLASPFLYRAYRIHEIYVYADVREHVLDSVFLLREEYGLTIGDLAIKDVVLDGDVIHITVHENYHGLIDRSIYDDLEVDYFVDYDYGSDSLSVVGVRAVG